MEIVLHTLRDYSHAKKFWNSLGVALVVADFFKSEVKNWHIQNLACNTTYRLLRIGTLDSVLVAGRYGIIQTLLLEKTIQMMWTCFA